MVRVGFLARAVAQRRLRRFYRQMLVPGDLCFDVGANVGERSRAMLAAGAQVVAVEPNPDCVSRLRLLPLTVVQAALGRECGRADLHLTAASTISSMSWKWIDAVRESGRFAEFDWDRSITVDVTTLDALMDDHGHPDFVKIDVEGYESEVLAGLSRPIPLLSFEFVPERQSDGYACIDHLVALGMTSFSFSPMESLRLDGGWLSADRLRERLQRLAPPMWGDVYARRKPPKYRPERSPQPTGACRPQTTPAARQMRSFEMPHLLIRQPPLERKSDALSPSRSEFAQSFHRAQASCS